jgi:phosphopantothenoylcysteine decarboxylase / phosphopantothenate---cysteine ligase
MLRGKKIIIGVCGSIAAYKAALLVRLLIKEGAEVKIAMTEAASHFIGPLTLATLSKNPVIRDFFDQSSGMWHSHVELGLWADAIVVAPASANSIGHFANGICENMLSAIYFSARKQVFVAPAMDLDMMRHPSVTQNIKKLSDNGNIIIDPSYGELASGLHGVGRMAEPEEILAVLKIYFEDTGKPLHGKRALITAGPTYEAIDPVRFIGNRSSGKMGYAIAHQIAELGGQVELISGPVSIEARHPLIKVAKVTSAKEMYEAAAGVYDTVDLAVFAAAVADYSPLQPFGHKLKKGIADLSIPLVKNVDIAYELGKIKKKNQLNIGFALETENEMENARSKMVAKNFDMVVLNTLKDQGAGFDHDTNKITLIKKDNKTEFFELKSKKEVARDIVAAIISELS